MVLGANPSFLGILGNNADNLLVFFVEHNQPTFKLPWNLLFLSIQ
jgi:hypothetical protein